MRKLIYIFKEISGGQHLTPRQRTIFMWWSTSLALSVVLAGSLLMCAIMVASFLVASVYMKELPNQSEEDVWND